MCGSSVSHRHGAALPCALLKNIVIKKHPKRIWTMEDETTGKLCPKGNNEKDTVSYFFSHI
jgi:hypothetical protein